MQIIIFLIFTFISTAAYADNISPLVQQLNDLSSKVSLGISLDTFATALSGIKSQYKLIEEDNIRGTNPLLDDNIKSAITDLEYYAMAWKITAVDDFKFVKGTSWGGYKVPYTCNRFGCSMSVSDIKAVIYADFKEKLEKTRSVHENGW